MSGKDRKEARKADKSFRAAALREFLVAMPGGLERVTSSLGWLVILGAVALIALVLHLVFGAARHPPEPAFQSGENPVSALTVRDLGRLPDGRHTFDLMYTLVLRNVTPWPQVVGDPDQRLTIGDPPADADVVDLGHAPGSIGDATGLWHGAIVGKATGSSIGPGQWHDFRAHYRIKARPDQSADVAMGYAVHHAVRGWFGHRDAADSAYHDEDVQLGAVLRAHCGLGVKVAHGEVRSLCGS